MNTLKITLDNLLDAKIEFVAGASLASLSEKYKISTQALKSRFLMLDKIAASKLPALNTTQQIIKGSINDKLIEVREKLSTKSLEIIERADERVFNDLESASSEISTKDVATISDMYSKRLGRLTGVEVDPTAGQDPNKANRVNIIINNIMDRFRTDVEAQEAKGKSPHVVDGEVLDN